MLDLEVTEAPLQPGEVVCKDCRLAYNGHLPHCTNCEAFGGLSLAIQAKISAWWDGRPKPGWVVA